MEAQKGFKYSKCMCHRRESGGNGGHGSSKRGNDVCFKNRTFAVEHFWRSVKVLFIEVQATQSYSKRDEKDTINLEDI